MLSAKMRNKMETTYTFQCHGDYDEGDWDYFLECLSDFVEDFRERHGGGIQMHWRDLDD